MTDKGEHICYAPDIENPKCSICGAVPAVAENPTGKSPDRGPVVRGYYCSNEGCGAIYTINWKSRKCNSCNGKLHPFIDRREWEKVKADYETILDEYTKQANEFIVLRGRLEKEREASNRINKLRIYETKQNAKCQRRAFVLQATHDKLRVGVECEAHEIETGAKTLLRQKAILREDYDWLMSQAGKLNALLRDGGS